MNILIILLKCWFGRRSFTATLIEENQKLHDRLYHKDRLIARLTRLLPD